MLYASSKDKTNGLSEPHESAARVRAALNLPARHPEEAPPAPVEYTAHGRSPEAETLHDALEKALAEYNAWRVANNYDSFSIVDSRGEPVLVPFESAWGTNKAKPSLPKSPSEDDIRAACSELAEFLVAKNRRYGDSALAPLRILSRGSPVDQILNRIDDKLCRISKGTDHEMSDETALDTERDLLGYFLLLRVARSREALAPNRLAASEPFSSP